MPLFVITCRDKADVGDLRLQTRPAHFEYLTSLGARVRIAGPFLDDDGVTMVGSLIVIEADSLKAASADAAGDPYAKAGLFANVQIKPWKWTMADGKPV